MSRFSSGAMSNLPILTPRLPELPWLLHLPNPCFGFTIHFLICQCIPVLA